MRLLALLAVSLPLAGCGGGGGGSPVTVTLLSSPALEGYVIKGNAMPIGGIYFGDVVNGGERGLRAFVSFDLALPANATVTKATLRFRQFQAVGAPHTKLGPTLVDQVVYGAVLEVGAYDRSFPSNQGLPLTPSNAALDTKTSDVTEIVRNCVQGGSTRAQFRLRFTLETNAGGDSDFAQFVQAGRSDEPTLVVTYQP